jgi:peptide/nickel transport system permease protein
LSKYVIRRLIASILVLFGVSILVFLMMHLTPGDPVQVMLHETVASERAIEEMRHNLLLDRPLPEQYLVWFIGGDLLQLVRGEDIGVAGTRRGVIRGDMGRSIFKRVPVSQLVVEKFPATLRLTLAAMALAIPLGILAGVISAVYRGTISDYSTMLAALVGVSLPSFWLGLMLMFVFGVELGWVRPFIGDRGFITLILPAITLSTPTIAIIARLTRSSMLDVLSENYIQTARAKGLQERRVVFQHGLRNAIIPVITILGLQFGYLLGGAVIVETVFAYPGLGREIVGAILNRDFPVVQGITLFTAASFVLINLIVDMMYMVVDPRISRD